jgi:hypothetical protein
MHETFRMLGEEREAEFAREAERRHLAASAARAQKTVNRRLRVRVHARVIRFAWRLLVVAPAKGGGDEL